MDEVKRCGWVNLKNPAYIHYHDNEWGREVTDDRKMFEFLVLESAQAGLSWITILRKRENYRKAFAGFDVHKVAAFTDDDVERLMQDPGRNLLCVRKADVTNRDSTFAELQGAIFRMFGEQYKRYWHINSSNMIMECKINRNQIIFRGVNDEKQREKLKSITIKRGK